MTWFLFALSSALLSAAAAVMQKKILFRISPLEFSFSVSSVILLVSCLAPFTVDVRAIPAASLVLILFKSALGAFAFLLVMMSLQKNQISSALPLLGLTPAVTAIFSMPALGESLGAWEWTAIALMIAGTYLIEKKTPRPTSPSTGPVHEATRHDPLHSVEAAPHSAAHVPIIGALVLFAVSAVADKALVSSFKIPPLAVLFYQHIVYCLVFGVMLAVRRSAQKHSAPATHPPLPLLPPAVRQHLVLIAGVALITIAYRFAQLEATKDAPAALVLAVKRTSIVFASFYGGTLFAEERLARKLIGAILIAGSGFLILRFLA